MDRQELQTRHEDAEIIRQLQELPVKEVPVNLKSEIMARIDRKKRSGTIINRIMSNWKKMNRPFTFSVRPVYAMATVVLLTGSFWLGRATVDVQTPHTTLTSNANGELISQVTNAESAYLLGRGLLAADKEKQGLSLLHKAAQLEPRNPEFAYWEGVGYWLNNDFEQERKSYLRGLSAAPRTVPLLVNLGHNYLAEGKYTQALDTYENVLAISPVEHDALYNQGLIFRKLGRTEDEIRTWKRFLDNYRTGTTAFRALDRLNSHGDFSYRSYQVGARRIILSQSTILNPQASIEDRYRELLPIVSIMEANSDLRLELVVFMHDNLAAAHSKAASLKRMLNNRAGTHIASRVAISWLDSPEQIQSGTETEYQLDRSLLIFNAVSTSAHDKEVSI